MTAELLAFFGILVTALCALAGVLIKVLAERKTAQEESEVKIKKLEAEVTLCKETERSEAEKQNTKEHMEITRGLVCVMGAALSVEYKAAIKAKCINANRKAWLEDIFVLYSKWGGNGIVKNEHEQVLPLNETAPQRKRKITA